MQIIISSVVEILIICVCMYFLTKHEEKAFIKELQKLSIAVDLKPILDKIENIKPCNFKEVIDEIKKINIPETDLTPVLEAIKRLEDKIETGEITIKNGVIDGNLTINGSLYSRGNVSAFYEGE